MATETRTFEAGATLPKLTGCSRCSASTWAVRRSTSRLFLALVARCLVCVLIWRSRLGYEIRTVGFNPTAAVYAGISVQPHHHRHHADLRRARRHDGAERDHGRSSSGCMLEFVGGAGFVGIAVALMGRSHPVGIVLASILFGMLYQGGAELAFDMPRSPAT